MPTLTYVEGFELQALSANQYGGSGVGIADTIVGAASIDTATKRTGLASLKIAPANAAAYVRRAVATPTGLVLSFYVNFSSLDATANMVAELRCTAGNNLEIRYRASTGKLGIRWGTATPTDANVTISTGTWYRIDVKADVSTTTRTATFAVDGTSAGPVTEGTTSTTFANYEFGETANITTYTAYYDDVVVSTTLADYPIGVHYVHASNPDGAGTDSNPSNMPVTGAATAWQALATVPPTTSVYVAETANGTGDYREVTFADALASVTTIWAVCGQGALFAAGTAACTGTTRIVDSAGTTLTDIYGSPADMSETSLHYRDALIAVPSGGSWDTTKFAGLKGRVGFSGDAAPDPRWAGLILQYASPNAAPTQTPQSVAVSATGTIALSRTTRKPVSTSSAHTVALSRNVGKLVAITATVTMAAAKSITHAVAVAATLTMVLARRTAKSIAASSAHAISLVASKVVTKAIAVTTAFTVALIRTVGKSVVVGTTLAASTARIVAKAIAVTTAFTVALIRSILRAIAVSVALTMVLARRTAKSIATSTAHTVGLARSTAKAIGMGLSAGVSITRSVAKSIATSTAHTVGLVTAKIKVVTIAVAATLTLALSRVTAKAIAASASLLASIVRSILKLVGISSAATAEVASQKIVGGGTTYQQAVVVSAVSTVGLATNPIIPPVSEIPGGARKRRGRRTVGPLRPIPVHAPRLHRQRIAVGASVFSSITGFKDSTGRWRSEEELILSLLD